MEHPDYQRCPVPGCNAMIYKSMYPTHVKRCKRQRDEDSSSDDGVPYARRPRESTRVAAANLAAAAPANHANLLGDAVDTGGAAEEQDAADDAPPAEHDPGLLDEAELRRRLLAWSLANPRLDPRHPQRFGAFNWSQMETVLEERMSQAGTKRHLARLHQQGCGGLGLTLRTREQVSRNVRSLLDDSPVKLAAFAGGVEAIADAAALSSSSLHFFEETLHVWNGKKGDESALVPRKLVMRELDAVMLAMFLDPRAYGRQRTRHFAPTARTASGDEERVYSHALTSDCYWRAEASAPGKQIVSADLFYDATVVMHNGNTYKPCADPRRRRATCDALRPPPLCQLACEPTNCDCMPARARYAGSAL